MPSIESIKSTAAVLGQSYGVDNIFLFGSYARGSNTPASDIDLRVDCGNIKTLLGLSALRLDFEEKLGLPVDLLATDSLDNKFLNSIKGEEIHLYGRNNYEN